MQTRSNRELARHLGVSETAVRRAEKAGRIRREDDGGWDVARVKAAWPATLIQPSSGRLRSHQQARQRARAAKQLSTMIHADCLVTAHMP